MHRGTALLILLLVSACATKFEAPPDAQISGAADAPGYIVVGLATQSYKRDLGHVTDAIGMGMARRQGGTVVASRDGCGSMRGFYGSKPCDLNKLDRRVLVVPTGDWVPLTVSERLTTWGSRKTLSDTLPFRNTVHVGPGEVIYIGDFTYASDYDAQEIKLVQYGRDDAAASQALAAYPGLKAAPVVYRDPTTMSRSP